MIAVEPPVVADDVHILVVDDVAENLLAMRALLERPGLRVLTAQGGEQALELLLVHDFALALLDVRMPGMDGYALAELMRGAERSRAVPIIFMTAETMDRQRAFRGYEAGAVDFLAKPVEQAVLLSKVAVFVELYEQRRRLAASVADLERALKLNEAMVAVLTHDLRTPLQAILVQAEVLRRRSADPAVQQTASGIRASGSRMGRMISQLLDFSRIRSGTLRLDRAAADLGGIARRVIDELQQAQPEARIALQATGDLAGVFDADRIMQVLANLVGNALQHGTAGGTVEVGLDGTDATWLRARVRNAGALDEGVRARLFEPFRPSSASTEGLGLGLYIVAQFVRAHGGQVHGAAEGGTHTVFSLELPRG